MSKLTKSALALVLIGLLICVACAAFAGFDFSDLSTSAPPTAQHFEFDAANAGIESIRISLSTDDLTVVESDDGLIHVKLYTYDYEEAKAEVEDGVLDISKERKGFKSWFNINLNFGDYTNVVSLPKGFQCDISASLSTGGVTITDMESLGSVSVTQSTGDTKIYNTNAKSMTVSCSTGGIKVENANISGDAAFTTSTGNCSLTNVSAGGALTRNCSTGTTTLKNVTCDSVMADSTTGSIRVVALDANVISLKATTGDVSGSVKGSIADYTITSDTSTGDNSLPKYNESGDRHLSVKTSTGDIEIRFE